jgi:hypothetical protein
MKKDLGTLKQTLAGNIISRRRRLRRLCQQKSLRWCFDGLSLEGRLTKPSPSRGGLGWGWGLRFALQRYNRQPYQQ